MIEYLKRKLTTRFAARTEPTVKGNQRASWGPWELHPDPEQPMLGYGLYRIPLTTCQDPARVLDWIYQIAGHPWADDRTLAGFVRALDDLLYPQANLCSGGEAKQLSPGQIHRLLGGRMIRLWHGQG